jgi:YfiH family protein
MIYATPHFSIYFGDASDKLYQYHYLSYTDNIPLPDREPYARVCKELNTEKLTFCHQIHSSIGYQAISSPVLYPAPFVHKGDYLITNQPIALGVMTADCLPIAFYDQKTGACGIVHAGWRGVASGVIEQACAHMNQAFGTSAADLHAVFGPAARACCYTVTQEFKEHFQHYVWHNELFVERESALFFDLSACVQHILQDCGIARHTITLDYNTCTICCTDYCSYRREKERAGRQMTIIART